MTSAPPITAGSIHAKLARAFEPDHLEVVDESERHRGHAGWREGGRTHFRVVLRSARFDGLGRIARARAVHRALHDELAGGVHALALELSGPADRALAARVDAEASDEDRSKIGGASADDRAAGGSGLVGGPEPGRRP